MVWDSDVVQSIEKAQADRANASFKKEYDASVRAQQEIIDGENHIVDDAFHSFSNTLMVPFIIELDYKYNQAAKSIDVSIELTEDPSLKMPMKKQLWRQLASYLFAQRHKVMFNGIMPTPVCRSCII